MDIFSPGSRLAVIGAGTIGASWAALFLAKGYEVCVFDPAPGSEALVRAAVEGAWPVLQRIANAPATPPWQRLTFAPTAAQAVAGAVFVQENGPENPALKAPLLAEIDAALPEGRIIASSTSGLTLDILRNGLARPDRILVGHPFNPPHLIPLVEVVGDEKTNPAAIERAMEFYRSIGKEPIRLTRSVTGHIANRLQAAVWREALYLVQEGVASARDVDAAMAYGPGLRWGIMGPTTTFHLGGGAGGIAAFVEKLGVAMQSWWDDLGDVTLTPELVKTLVEEMAQLPDIAALKAERDRRIVAMLEAAKE